jgi:predicted DNA-binding protein
MSCLVGVMRPIPVNPQSVDQIARTRTEEVPVMSILDNTNGRGSVKTLAIRLEPDLHAQLSLIAQLRSSTITDEIRQAIEAHITSIKASPELAGKADSVLADIEREAVARRQAIASLFGTDQPVTAPAATATTSSTRPARKSGSAGDTGN